MIEDMGEAADTGEIGTVLHHHDTGVPAVAAVTIMTVGMYPARELLHNSSHHLTKYSCGGKLVKQVYRSLLYRPQG